MEGMMRKYLFLVLMFVFYDVTVSAAPIGVPGATVGVDRSNIGFELDFLIDRDLAGPGDAEGMTLFARGEVGVTKRVDLLARLGFGRFEVRGSDSDTGPAFGIGTKVTWAEVPDARIKIGSVAQMTQIRADNGANRQSFTAYDLAVGLFADAGRPLSSKKNELVVTTYGGFVFSSLDVESNNTGGVEKEDTAYGLFGGLLMNLNAHSSAGIEVRLVGQTALSIYTSIAF